jgi:hypothetical protein
MIDLIWIPEFGAVKDRGTYATVAKQGFLDRIDPEIEMTDG